MNFRISLLIPVLLIVSSIACSLWFYFDSKNSADESIHKDTRIQVNLDITRLKNVIHNKLTESEYGLQDSRLNLSVTAMDPVIKTLSVLDENNNIILSNRYAIENTSATKSLKGFDQYLAQKIRLQNSPVVEFQQDNNKILHGYYPVILKSDSASGLALNKVGILFLEVDITNRLTTAYKNAANRAMKLASVLLLVSFLVAFLLHKLISKRLILLNRASDQLARGNLDIQVSLKGRDELAQLGNAFDDMVLQIKDDIHKRIKAEHDLREFNETLEQRVAERTSLLSEAQSIGHIGNWSWDINSGKIDWSDEIFRIFGYQPGEFEPTYERFISTLHPDDVDDIKNSEKEAFEKGTTHSIDHRIVLPDGSERWVHEEAIAKLDADGNAVSLSGTVQDITERKSIEHSLRDAKNEAERLSEAKSKFLSHMSHELRTPMNAILGFSQLLAMQSLTEKQLSFVGEIDTAGKHLLSLIGELLDLSRIEAGRTMIVLESIYLKQVLDESIKITESLIQEKDLQLNLQCDPDQKVIADTTRLRQVFVNLLSNAAKYNRKGHSITVSCKQEDEVIKVMVQDEGVGIEVDELPKLFKPFERLGAELNGIDGTGIGLALSKQLIKLMNGDIGVESVPGKGSTFWVEIPVAKRQHITTEQINNINKNENHIYNILYIEDDVSSTRLVEKMLGYNEQFKLISAHSGHYGVELAIGYIPDIILLDINLPDLSGYEVLKRLRENEDTKSIPVIALSADKLPADIKRGMDAGFNDYLVKPIKFEILIDTLMKYGKTKTSIEQNHLNT